MTADDLLLVGRVARAHGIRGQVIVNPATDFPDERFKVGNVVLVGTEDRHVPRTIAAVRFHQGRPVIAFEGIETMNDAERLADAGLWMPASQLAPLPEDTYYRHDLVGCEVRDEAGTHIGLVTAVDGPLERSHLVVQGARGESLMPLAGHICVRIDVGKRLIVVRLPDGLLDVYDAPTRG